MESSCSGYDSSFTQCWKQTIPSVGHPALLYLFLIVLVISYLLVAFPSCSNMRSLVALCLIASALAGSVDWASLQTREHHSSAIEAVKVRPLDPSTKNIWLEKYLRGRSSQKSQFTKMGQNNTY